MNWNPAPSPFPAGPINTIKKFEYLDELKLVLHSQVHVDMVPKSLWQLAGDFRARLTIRPKQGAEQTVIVTAPRGMFTDLASVPKIFWSFIGPIGPHLEASILHDYLYMAWTDFRDTASQEDWNFADAVLMAGMEVSKVKPSDRTFIYTAVHSPIGWNVFAAKKWTLKTRMEAWLPLLEDEHTR